MILSQREAWTEVAGGLTAAALLPFYMGFLHLNLGQLLLYSAVAGTLLTAGEHLRLSAAERFALSDFLGDWPMWTLMVLGLGLLAWGLALWLV